MIFRYTAYDRSGQRRVGTAEAASAGDIEERLWEANLIVGKVSRVYRLPALHEALPTVFGLKPRHIVTFTRQMVTLLDSGLPLLKALDILAAQPLHPLLKATARDVRQQVTQGTMLSEAMSKHPKAFPRLYIRMAKIGEETGNLADMLGKVADTVERALETRSKLRSSLTYPALVFLAALGSLYVMLNYTIPMMSGLFQEFHAKMPIMTRMVLVLSAFVHGYGSRAFLVALALGGLGFLYGRTRTGAQRRDELLLRLPALGPVFRKTQVAAFSDTLTRVMESGVPLVEALELARDTTENLALRRILGEVIQSVTAGNSLSQSLSRYPHMFPPLVTETVKVAEETGSLADQLRLVAKIYQKEAEQAVADVVQIVEPAVVLLVGGIVGFIAMAVLSTVYGVLPNVK
ncbi:MAG: type II secretion system F family protein [Chloroflexi bacterium]|nr:type II secretion system F family protein [Chloroflexota bacterium]